AADSSEINSSFSLMPSWKNLSPERLKQKSFIWMITTKLKIRIYGDPILRRKASLVKAAGPAERMLIASMLETMYEHKGIGLAAPQVGVSEQIFVADIGEGPLVVVNPQILSRSGSQLKEEGCLSIPGIVLNVKRPQKIRVKYLNEDNKVVEKEYSDLLARVILHETDHLKGKLIIDYASLIEQRRLKKKLKAIQPPSS
ncbi:MAG TPA: peptide deformylase, partial [Candidatus Omnitrophota bacterium]|nr:peptide deformylase [Candidatus Omnitrophota bacterium]